MGIIARMSLIGIYGGTFDPIHYGHLRIAEELTDMAGMQRIMFIPSGSPRLRNEPAASRNHRVAMTRLAIQDNPRFSLDEREVNRPGISTTVQTLREYRHELGDDAALSFIVGIDAFMKLNQWTEWLELFRLGHLIVVARPGYIPLEEDQQLPAEVRNEYIARRTTDASDLGSQPGGFIYAAHTSMLDISASRIRALINAGKSIRYLLPDNVSGYIQSNRLYTGNL